MRIIKKYNGRKVLFGLIALGLASTLVLPVFGSDTYINYAALAAEQVQGVDYQITSNDTASSVEIIGIHGGGIEPGTSELVKGIAGTDYDSYLFEGLKSSGNSVLHITSTNFDEPQAIALTKKSSSTISIHGCAGTDQIVYLGGLDKTLGSKLTNALKAAGFIVAPAPSTINASDPLNIVNRNTKGAGVQLELTNGLRRSLYNDFTSASARASSENGKYKSFVNAIRSVLKHA